MHRRRPLSDEQTLQGTGEVAWMAPRGTEPKLRAQPDASWQAALRSHQYCSLSWAPPPAPWGLEGRIPALLNQVDSAQWTNVLVPVTLARI